MTDADRRDLLRALDSAPGPGRRFTLAVANATGGVGGNASDAAAAAATAAFGNGTWLEASLARGPTVGMNDSLRNDTAELPADPEEGNQFWMLVTLLVPFLTIFGNVLVVLAVRRERSLQSATNYFIVSLAFADILVAAIVMPVSVVVEVRNGRWDFSDQLCDLWIMCDALFSTASILNLVAISIDRFIAVTQPIKYAKHKNSKRTHFTIAATWLLSIGIALPIGCGLQNMQGLRYHEKFRHVCTFFNGDFLIYSSLGSFYIPCIVMLVLYHRIFTVIRSRAKKAGKAKKLRMSSTSQQQQQQSQRQQASNCNHSAAAAAAPPRRPQTLTSPQKVPAVGDCLACQTDGIYTGEQPVPHTCQQRQDGASLPRKGNSIDSPLQPLTESQTLAGPSISDNSDGGGGGGGGGGGEGAAGDCGDCGKSGRKKQQLFQQLKLRKKPSNKMDRSAARREKKATKTLAIVLGVFLLCWLPFFITNLMWAACLKNFNDQESLAIICQYDRRINVFIVWLGYVNSFLNPLIYTIFNTEFRKAFKKLLNID